ncbi:hypothetical protein RF11_11108 [Thelohanellus kitauei]|uniref:Uncharacterized protein n=1 Tax=Thelohanellus kitauei TaxID=669202 RepID=A0A0C2N699_THEKT|nr:hypothetical protein RF11_11108 [Thelohanellus kitauei]
MEFKSSVMVEYDDGTYKLCQYSVFGKREIIHHRKSILSTSNVTDAQLERIEDPSLTSELSQHTESNTFSIINGTNPNLAFLKLPAEVDFKQPASSIGPSPSAAILPPPSCVQDFSQQFPCVNFEQQKRLSTVFPQNTQPKSTTSNETIHSVKQLPISKVSNPVCITSTEKEFICPTCKTSRLLRPHKENPNILRCPKCVKNFLNAPRVNKKQKSQRSNRLVYLIGYVKSVSQNKLQCGGEALTAVYSVKPVDCTTNQKRWTFLVTNRLKDKNR